MVIASASQFHGKYDEGLIDLPAAKIQGAYAGNLESRLKAELGAEAFETLSPEDKNSRFDALPKVDKQLAAMLVKRDAKALADSLESLTGNKAVSQFVFGIGVVGMAVSTIIILMLINGFTFTEMLGAKIGGMKHRIGAMLPGVTGLLGYLWFWRGDKPDFWLAVPTSVFGMVLLPIAYISFFLMINSKKLMGDAMPKGGKRVVLNIAMLVALAAATIGAGGAIWNKVQWTGVIIVGVFVFAALMAHFLRSGRSRDN